MSTEQEDFEVWAKADGRNIEHCRYEGYKDAFTLCAWFGWKARADAEEERLQALELEHMGDPDKKTGI